VERTSEFFSKLKLTSRETQIGVICWRRSGRVCNSMGRVGLGYLQLDRLGTPPCQVVKPSVSDSPPMLGSNLQGVCYVLDEPTIGLHPRDNEVLLDAHHADCPVSGTRSLSSNTTRTPSRRADYVLDLGPQAGVRGGEVVGAGTGR